MGADPTKQGAGKYVTADGTTLGRTTLGPPRSVGLSSEDPSEGVVDSDCVYPDAAFCNFYRDIYL